MYILQNEMRYETLKDMVALCTPWGIEIDHWDVASLDQSMCRDAAVNQRFQATILEQFQRELTVLKQKNGYVTEDIVCLSQETPNLPEILAMFDKEHHHTEDEVRLMLSGDGVFGIHPPAGMPFEIHLSPGDIIVIPAYMRHWFKMGPTGHVVTIRVFKSQSGWKAIYDPVLAAPLAATSP